MKSAQLPGNNTHDSLQTWGLKFVNFEIVRVIAKRKDKLKQTQEESAVPRDWSLEVGYTNSWRQLPAVQLKLLWAGLGVVSQVLCRLYFAVITVERSPNPPPYRYYYPSNTPNTN